METTRFPLPWGTLGAAMEYMRMHHAHHLGCSPSSWHSLFSCDRFSSWLVARKRSSREGFTSAYMHTAAGCKRFVFVASFVVKKLRESNDQRLMELISRLCPRAHRHTLYSPEQHQTHHAGANPRVGSPGHRGGVPPRAHSWLFV